MGLSPCCCLIPGAGSIFGLSICWATPGKALQLPPAVFLLLTVSLFLLFPFPVLGPSSSLPRAAGSPLSASLGAPQGMPRPRGQFPRRRQPSAPPVPPLSRAAPFLPPTAREGGKLPCARKSLPGPPSHGFRAQSHTASLPSAITGVPAASRGGENPTQLSQGHRWLPVTSLTPPSWGLPAWRCRFLGEQAWCWGRAAGVTHPIPLGFSPAPL